jgi:hypothetical protein
MAKALVAEFHHHNKTTEYGDSAVIAVAADVLVIPLTHPLVNKTTGNDSEALTIEDGTYPGQTVTILLGTDGGGTGTLTVGTNSTGWGWATIAFADAGDQATLLWIDDTLGWMIWGAKGYTQPPVIA